jgi:F-type H+-transporting ATPase subunit a
MSARLLAALTPAALALAAPATALGAGFQPQNEFKVEPIGPELKVGPVDLSFNRFVLYLLLTAIATCVTMIWIARRMQGKPNRVQTAVEAVYDLTSNQITRGNIDKAKVAGRWFPFIATLFLFIWFANMIGYIPLPTNFEHTVDIAGLHIPTFALYAATANFSMPLALTLIVWFSYHIEGIREKGPIKYVKGWIPAGVTGITAVPVFIIEALSQLLRLGSLSARLFANILAGHMLLLLTAGGMSVILGIVWLNIVTIPVGVAFWIFEIGLVATLQAYIFAMLSSIYLGEAVAEEH